MLRSVVSRRWIAEGALASLTDAEVVRQMFDKKIKFHELEKGMKPDYERAVNLRREFLKEYMNRQERRGGDLCLNAVPYKDFDYTNVVGSNCENIIGYIPIPVGMAGPILLDGAEYPIPMATTEGALVASTHRGARCISRAGGCRSFITNEGMTRAPVVSLRSLEEAVSLQKWVEGNMELVKVWFNATTRFGKLDSCMVRVVGRKVYLRFRAVTGDAMGMNMISKGVDAVMNELSKEFPHLEVVSLSGNMCTDKKPSAINWVEGRGKSIACEAVIPPDLVRDVLKTSVDALVSLNIDKNLIGSAMAGSIGGFNAHAANAVAAVFLAAGQDPAQVVESSSALTCMEKTEDGSLRISVTMPSIEVGTVGGGTTLAPQNGILKLMDCAGPCEENPGANAQQLAKIVGAAVLSAELSLMAGLAAGHLVRAHMELNRK